jgi:hypothetical protein
MRRHGRVFAQLVAAGSLLIVSIAAAKAAGALAIGSCGAYGFAYDHSDDRAAQSTALGKCVGSCKIVTAIKRNCAALAVDGQNKCGAHGFAAAARLGIAQNVALRECYQHGGKDCMIRAFVCDAKG